MTIGTLGKLLKLRDRNSKGKEYCMYLPKKDWRSIGGMMKSDYLRGKYTIDSCYWKIQLRPVINMKLFSIHIFWDRARWILSGQRTNPIPSLASGARISYRDNRPSRVCASHMPHSADSKLRANSGASNKGDASACIRNLPRRLARLSRSELIATALAT